MRSDIKGNLCDYCRYHGNDGICHAAADDSWEANSEGLSGEALCDMTDEELDRYFYGF